MEAEDLQTPSPRDIASSVKLYFLTYGMMPAAYPHGYSSAASRRLLTLEYLSSFLACAWDFHIGVRNAYYQLINIEDAPGYQIDVGEFDRATTEKMQTSLYRWLRHAYPITQKAYTDINNSLRIVMIMVEALEADTAGLDKKLKTAWSNGSDENRKHLNRGAF